ncbi:hypothetical protein [Microcoleus sp. F10-C6]|uniref:hypothetical protein n=1 Tax=Microcoleus sp. F10-C6 TaxID=2818757 RepID=UPI002FD481CF
MPTVSADRNFGHQIAGDSISRYLVGINSRILLATHSQKNQDKISLKPPYKAAAAAIY